MVAAQDSCRPDFALQSSGSICFSALALYQAVGDASGFPHQSGEGYSNAGRHVLVEESLLHLHDAFMHCLSHFRMGALIEVVLGIVGASTARARARLSVLSYFGFLVTHI